MVSMMLPSGLAELLGEFELELPLKSAIELSINDEMMDCAVAALVEEEVPDADELDAPFARAFIRL